MSVLKCDRAGCENVMCDRLSDQYGYICWKCFDELVASGVVDIQAFMRQEFKHEKKSDDEFYGKIFPSRQD